MDSDEARCWSMEGGGCGSQDRPVERARTGEACDSADSSTGDSGDSSGEGQLEGAGCQVASGPLWAALLLVWLRRLFWVLLLAAQLAPPLAQAADAQLINPSPGDFVALDDAVLEPWSVSAALSAQTLSNPAVLRSGAEEQPVLSRVSTGALDLQAMVGPVELAALLPVHLGVQGFGTTLTRIPGDVRLRVTLPVGDAARWGVAVHIPRGGHAALLGSPGAVSSQWIRQSDQGPVSVQTQLGVALQREEDLPGLVWGPRLTWGLGLEGDWQGWSASAELLGQAPLPVTGVPGAWPVEALVSLGVPGGRLRVGVGHGLTRGFGAPDWRVVAVLGTSSGEAQDQDMDGIVDPRDLCRERPEDHDGYRDEDGCPELDNDQDGFVDARDDCPNQAEVYNGLEDEDGCPDRASVLRVRVLGDTDALERARVSVDGEELMLLGGEIGEFELPPGEHRVRASSEGHRGVELSLVLEPGGTLVELVLEELVYGELLVRMEGPSEGWLRVEGAELPIAGERLLELPSGPQLVRVGAPGWASASGVVAVPAHGRAEITLRPLRLDLDLEGGEVLLAEDVHFELDSCEVLPGSGLRSVADWMLVTPSVALVRVEGHADELGGPAYNYQLSLCRAQAVRAWLIEEGVEPERLVAIGAGEALADGERSRRVGFLVLVWDEAVAVQAPDGRER